MKHLKSYNELNENRIDEGWKEWTLAGLLAVSNPIFSQKIHYEPGDRVPKHIRHDNILPGSDAEKLLLDQGYTLIGETPHKRKNKHTTSSIKIEFGKSESSWFESGGYKLSDLQKEELKNIVDSLKKQQAVIKEIRIKSSTDKMGIGESLKKEGIMTNQNLSKVRSEQVKNYLKECGMDTSNIKEINLYEQGKDLVTDKEKKDGDKSARYVIIEIDYEINIKVETINPVPKRLSYEINFDAGVKEIKK